VVYLHHLHKGSSRQGKLDQRHAARRASSLTDTGRWFGYVAKMTKDEAARMSDRPHDKRPIGEDRRGFYARFGVSKQNYDTAHLEQWYKRGDGGVLLPVEMVKAEAKSEEEPTEARRQDNGF